MTTNAHAARPRFEQFTMATQAAICDLGVALLPKLLIEDELSSASYSLTGLFEARIPIACCPRVEDFRIACRGIYTMDRWPRPAGRRSFKKVDVDLSNHEKYS